MRHTCIYLLRALRVLLGQRIDPRFEVVSFATTIFRSLATIVDGPRQHAGFGQSCKASTRRIAGCRVMMGEEDRSALGCLLDCTLPARVWLS